MQSWYNKCKIPKTNPCFLFCWLIQIYLWLEIYQGSLRIYCSFPYRGLTNLPTINMRQMHLLHTYTTPQSNKHTDYLITTPHVTALSSISARHCNHKSYFATLDPDCNHWLPLLWRTARWHEDREKRLVFPSCRSCFAQILNATLSWLNVVDPKAYCRGWFV